MLEPWRPPRTPFRNAIAAQTAALMLTLMTEKQRKFTPGGLFEATYDRKPLRQEAKQISMALGTLKGLGLIQCTFSRQGTKDICFRHVSDATLDYVNPTTPTLPPSPGAGSHYVTFCIPT